MSLAIKICGIRTPEAIDSAARAGATHAGFVFYPPSPRAIAPDAARALASRTPSLKSVALTVDATDAELEAVVRGAAPDILQLHGHEPPARVAAIRAAFGRPVMKAVAITTGDDVAAAMAFEDAADMLLFDASPGILPGGNGLPFDWTLLAGRQWKRPWMLSGGLTPANVAAAIHQTGARGVDVSSGVEKVRGEKDPQLITEFIRAAQAAFAPGRTQ